MPDDGVDIGRGVECDSRFAGFLERCQLTVDEIGVCEVSGAGRESCAQDLAIGFQVHEPDGPETACQQLPMMAGQRRAREDQWLASVDRVLDDRSERCKPALSIAIGQRVAASHLRDACRCVKVVGVDPPPAQTLPERRCDGRLSGPGWPHQDNHHCVV